MTQANPTSPSSAWTSAIEALWIDQSRWSLRANELASKRRNRVGPLALFGLLGVVLSTLTPEMLRWFGLTEADSSAPRFLITLIGPLIVAGTAYWTRELIGPKKVELWVRAREISEALKAEGFIYVTGAPPYGDSTTAPAALHAKVAQLTEEQVAFAPLPEADNERLKQYPHQPTDEATYVARRVEGQSRWHEKEARIYHQKLEYCRKGTLFLGFVSVILGGIAGAIDSAGLNVWIAVVSTAIATLASFAYANRYEFLVSSYCDTAARLVKRLRARQLEEPGAQEGFARFVLDCETILAGQNRSWSQKLTEAPPSAASAQTTASKGANVATTP